MKRNIQFIVLVLAALCLNTEDAFAQNRSYSGDIGIEPVRLEQSGDFLYIDMNFILKDVKVRTAHGVDFIPQLVAPANTYNLPKVSVKGKDEYLAYERRLSLMSAKEKRKHVAPYLVKKSNKRTNDTIRYRYVLPYESWMADAKLNVQRDECGCGESTLMSVQPVIDQVTLERILSPYIVNPHFAYVEPKVEVVKSREIQAECFLDFEVNKINIRPEYMNNPRELAKIRVMIDDLTTRGVTEPYRMFTSRAEYRLSLREDNADARLAETAHRLGVLGNEKYDRYMRKKEAVEKELSRLKATWVNPKVIEAAEAERVLGTGIEREYNLAALLSRPNVSYYTLMSLKKNSGELVSEEPLTDEAQIEQIEIALKYKGYIERQKEEVQKTLAHEEMVLPSDLDYDKVIGLSFEVRQKLKAVRPETLGQASRISGVTPAAVSLLLVYLKRLKWGN